MLKKIMRVTFLNKFSQYFRSEDTIFKTASLAEAIGTSNNIPKIKYKLDKNGSDFREWFQKSKGVLTEEQVKGAFKRLGRPPKDVIEVFDPYDWK